MHFKVSSAMAFNLDQSKILPSVNGLKYLKLYTEHYFYGSQDDDVTVFAVGVGRRTDIKELRAIASEPSEQFVFTVSNFDLLQSIREELAMSACAGWYIDTVKTMLNKSKNATHLS